MNIVVPTALILAGLLCLWIAVRGKTVYYGRLGAINRYHLPRIPIPRKQGRLLFGFMGAFALFIAIWGLMHGGW